MAKKDRSTSGSSNGHGHDEDRDVRDALASQHSDMKAKAKQLDGVETAAKSIRYLRDLVRGWDRLSELKHELVYPALIEAGVDADAVHEAMIESDIVAIMLGDLARRDMEDEMFVPALRVASRSLQRAIELESGDDGLMAKAAKSNLDLEQLNSAISEHMAERDDGEARYPAPRCLRGVGASQRRAGGSDAGRYSDVSDSGRGSGRWSGGADEMDERRAMRGGESHRSDAEGRAREPRRRRSY
ncbi:MAG: hypothetical protein AB7O57_12110 [Hyphomicrobiaceae bacterium]